MSHADTCWRVGAIHRCCVRYGKDYEWCKAQLSKLRELTPNGVVIAHPSFSNLADIWFRRSTPIAPNHIEKARHAFKQGHKYP